MGDLSASTKDSKAKKEEEVLSDEVRETSPTHVSLDIPADSEHTRWRILHRVPPQMRENKKHIYDPVVIPLGPYHDHSQPQFRQAEKLKDEVLNITCGAEDKAGFFRSKIQERVDEIRHFYGGVSKDEYGDEALAEMMLRDACFLIYYMEDDTDEGSEKYDHIVRRLGMSGTAFLFRDLVMLENQIPLWVIKLLISLKSDDDKDHDGEALLYNFLSSTNFWDFNLTRVPWEDKEEEPLHLLEAHRTMLVREDQKSSTDELEPIKNHRRHWINFKSRWKSFKGNNEDSPVLPSVTELKAKGIQFGPSSNCLKDIRFTSYWFYGKLQLPIKHFTNNTHIFFSNLVALEMSPETHSDYAMISYIHFMKSLIETPKDVKELRRKGILTSILANDEEIVKMFKEIDTYAAHNEDFFNDVKMRINKHCNSKAKTWMAELAYTYFRSPCTAIALFAATFLLCLTFLQTYYTINPRSN